MDRAIKVEDRRLGRRGRGEGEIEVERTLVRACEQARRSCVGERNDPSVATAKSRQMFLLTSVLRLVNWWCHYCVPMASRGVPMAPRCPRPPNHPKGGRKGREWNQMAERLE